MSRPCRRAASHVETLIFDGAHEWHEDFARPGRGDVELERSCLRGISIERVIVRDVRRDDDPQAPPARSRNRAEIPEKFKWNVQDIFSSWETWDAAYKQLEAGVDRYASLKGTLAQGPETLLERVPALGGARTARLPRLVLPVAAVRRGPARQHDQRAAPAGADPVRALEAGRVVVQPGTAAGSARHRPRRGWTRTTSCALYRFAIENLYRQQEHVLDEAGERLMSLASRLASAPNDAYWALSTVGREVSARSRSRPARKSRSRTASTARSSRRGTNRPTARRRSPRCTRPTSRRSTPTPRSTTPSASATGSRRARAATRARSRRRCTATTSRPRSSKT